jgi:hypothetical protein
MIIPDLMPQYDCGTWVADSIKITDWEGVDTLKKPVKTTEREWIENSTWQHDVPQYVYAVYRPCGDDPTHSEYQYRVCSITGIRQKRYRIYLYHYVEPVKSEYQKTVDKFKNK